MKNRPQVIFARSDATYFPDGRIVECVSLRGLNFALPAGMHARYEVVTLPDGSTRIEGFKQARSKHGKHYLFRSDECSVQAELLKWSARILRERAAEITLPH